MANTEPLKPGTTFWYVDGEDSAPTQIEVGELIDDSGQRYRWRDQDERWNNSSTHPENLLDTYSERVEPPHPIAYTLADIVRGVESGRLNAEGLRVRVDNDSAYAERFVEGEDEPVEVWSGDNVSNVLVELLCGLGLIAERA